MNSTQQLNYHNFIVDTPISKAEKSVLIISNCESTSKRLQAIIQKLNHKCIAVVTNYFKADKIIASQEPDVVIISTDMEGGLNGYDIAKYLKLDYDLPFFLVQKEENFENLKWSAELNPDANLFLDHGEVKLTARIKDALS